MAISCLDNYDELGNTYHMIKLVFNVILP